MAAPKALQNRGEGTAHSVPLTPVTSAHPEALTMTGNRFQPSAAKVSRYVMPQSAGQLMGPIGIAGRAHSARAAMRTRLASVTLIAAGMVKRRWFWGNASVRCSDNQSRFAMAAHENLTAAGASDGEEVGCVGADGVGAVRPVALTDESDLCATVTADFGARVTLPAGWEGDGPHAASTDARPRADPMTARCTFIGAW
jgi:hypothetical protein